MLPENRICTRSASAPCLTGHAAAHTRPVDCFNEASCGIPQQHKVANLPSPSALTLSAVGQIQNSRGSPGFRVGESHCAIGNQPRALIDAVGLRTPRRFPAAFLYGNPVVPPAVRSVGHEVRHRPRQRPVAVRPRRMVKIILRNDLGQRVSNSPYRNRPQAAPESIRERRTVPAVVPDVTDG